jgi:predicted PurR-regulated permease PerM
VIEKLSKVRRNGALAVLAVLVIWFSWTVRSVLNPVVLGYIFASTLHPMVRKVEQRGWSRRASVNLIFVGFSAVLLTVGLGIYAQGRMMVHDVFDADIDLIGRVERSFDDFVEAHRGWFDALLPEDDQGGVDGGAVAGGGVDGGAARGGAARGGAVDGGAVAPASDEPRAFSELVRGAWEALSDEQIGAGKMALEGAGSAWSMLQNWFGSVLGFLTLALLLPIYTYFLLFELGRIRGFFRRHLPRRERHRVSDVAGQIGEVLASFFRGRLLICFLKGFVITIGLWIVGIPYALLLGMGSGFLALVPFVGPLLGFLMAFLMGLLPEGAEFLQTLLLAGLVFGVAEVVEGYVLIPKILGDSLGLHPVVILVSVFAGGAALGIFGLLIAIPLMASVVILTREFVLPALAQFADEDETAQPKKGKGSKAT